MVEKVEHLTYEDILKEASEPHVTADTLNLLVARTRELSALRQHEADKLHGLLDMIEAKLADKG